MQKMVCENISQKTISFFKRTLSLGLLIGLCSWQMSVGQDEPDAQAPSAPEKEAMQVGGFVTVDAYGDPETIDKTEMSIRNVFLSANVNFAPGAVASIGLFSRNDLTKIEIVQALVSWNATKNSSFIFGNQTYCQGLFTTRMITITAPSDLLYTYGPGISGSYTTGPFTSGLGFTYLEVPSYYQKREGSFRRFMQEPPPPTKDFKSIVNFDYLFLQQSICRLALSYFSKVFIVNLGTNITSGPLAVDVEGFMEAANENAGATKRTAYSVGAAYTLFERLSLAARYDAASPDMFKNLDQQLAFGTTLQIKYGIFASVEYDRWIPHQGDGSNRMWAQIGLQSTIKLPGFQVKSLTQNQ